MSEQIKNLVEQNIPAEYRREPRVQQVVDNVVRSIDEARTQAGARLLSLAVDKGVTEDEARQALTEVGLLDRPVAVTASATEDDRVLARLVEFAKRHGFRG